MKLWAKQVVNEKGIIKLSYLFLVILTVMNHVGISPKCQEDFTVLRYKTNFILNDTSAFITKALHS